MRRLASIVAILLLWVTALPALACVTDRAMSRQEHSCCRTMHGQCGTMASQGCCRMELRTGERPQRLTAPPHTDVQWSIFAQLVSIAPPDSTISVSLLRSPAEHAPPGLSSATIAILRI